MILLESWYTTNYIIPTNSNENLQPPTNGYASPSNNQNIEPTNNYLPPNNNQNFEPERSSNDNHYDDQNQ